MSRAKRGSYFSHLTTNNISELKLSRQTKHSRKKASFKFGNGKVI